MEHKVSIIVPIYKVEKYIEKCIECILNQTYKNIEIILVDDGSPDRCGEICDKYAKKDLRIKSLHKKNGGLSDARNYGMKYMTGNLVLFLDSDDWMEATTIEKMVNLMDKYKVDIVQAGFYYAYNDYLLYDDRHYKEDDKDIVLNKEEAMRELIINEKIKNFAWGKLYKSELVKNIFFEKGKHFEDVFWAHQVFHQCDKYLINHEPLFYYMQREDSIVGNYSIKNLDIIEGLQKRQKFIEENYIHLISESRKILLKTILLHHELILRNKNINKNFRKKLLEEIFINIVDYESAVVDDFELTKNLNYLKKNEYLYIANLFIDKVKNKILKNKSYKNLKIVEYKNE